LILVEKYRPTTLDDFIGITDAREFAGDLIASPVSCALLFVGASGTGKTSLAYAIADAISAEVHHIPSQSCTADTVRSLRDKLAYMPMFGASWHVCIVDEADEMSRAAENAWLSMTDNTNRPANTIIIFTCNTTENFTNPDRFMSRTEVVRFSSYGIAKEATDLLARVWESETANALPVPNFARIVKEANNNIRESLQVLQRHVRRATRQNTGE
jgi:replication-associated recombination protein RarA